jgi:hypothetical protein
MVNPTWKLKKGTEGSPYKFAAFSKSPSRQRFFDTIQDLGDFLMKEGATQDTAAEAIRTMQEAGEVTFTIDSKAN